MRTESCADHELFYRGRGTPRGGSTFQYENQRADDCGRAGKSDQGDDSPGKGVQYRNRNPESGSDRHSGAAKAYECEEGSAGPS